MNYKLIIIIIFSVLFTPYQLSSEESKEKNSIDSGTHWSSVSDAELSELEPAAGGSISPCSQRYKSSSSFSITMTDIGRPAIDVIKDWIISHEWGLSERASVIKGPSEHNGALKIFYPKDSINPDNDIAPQGGAGFHAIKGFGLAEKSACLRYKVRFIEGFQFGRGGKLPGLFGGRSISGCDADAGITGFSTRYMWRENGKGSLYAYIPSKTEKCGTYIGMGTWTFIPNKWYTLEQEIIMNTVGLNNGILRVWVNGKNVINLTNVLYRNTVDITIEGLFFSTFFGGSDPTWASPKDQSADFGEFKVYFP